MYNQNAQPNPKTVIKTTIIIHLALFIGQAIFMVLAIFSAKNPAMRMPQGNDPLFLIACVLVIGGIFLGTFLFKQTLGKVTEGQEIMSKLSLYQTALIVRCALSEAASLFSIVCFLLTENYFFLCVAIVNMLYFIFIRPTKSKIQENLNLGFDEQAEIEGNAQ